MRWYGWCGLVLAGIVVAGCRTGAAAAGGEGGEMTLEIRWQRLVDEKGETCTRCGGTQKELGKAIGMLTQALSPLGIHVRFEEKALSAQECADDIMESNRIWIAGRPLEDWLDADVGATECESCCEQLGETVECRTTSVAGRTYEVIPAQLIVKAGLQAAAQLIDAPAQGQCCPGAASEGPASCECGR